MILKSDWIIATGYCPIFYNTSKEHFPTSKKKCFENEAFHVGNDAIYLVRFRLSPIGSIESQWRFGKVVDVAHF